MKLSAQLLLATTAGHTAARAIKSLGGHSTSAIDVQGQYCEILNWVSAHDLADQPGHINLEDLDEAEEFQGERSNAFDQEITARKNDLKRRTLQRVLEEMTAAEEDQMEQSDRWAPDADFKQGQICALPCDYLPLALRSDTTRPVCPKGIGGRGYVQFADIEATINGPIMVAHTPRGGQIVVSARCECEGIKIIIVNESECSIGVRWLTELRQMSTMPDCLGPELSPLELPPKSQQTGGGCGVLGCELDGIVPPAGTADIGMRLMLGGSEC